MDEKLEKAMPEVDEEDRYGIGLEEARSMFGIFKGDEKFVDLIPKDDFYLETPATYELWKFRKSDKAIPYKVLYGVMEKLLERIDRAERMARSAGWRE